MHAIEDYSTHLSLSQSVNQSVSQSFYYTTADFEDSGLWKTEIGIIMFYWTILESF